ncbi:hypothetical protein [Alphaproteobacteria bacterium endosymbiont of Tiliacea citrago]|uniref:hypothetical protein n=1 Tax=Alphaproteobacteria bacterium endosymbiont of Tiliacea citrago TaxID=3077944 RepID=UPI00313CA2E6
MNKIVFIVLMFQAFFLISKEIMVDSVEELITILKQEKNEKTLIIIDIIDIAIEHKSKFLHQENKARLVKILREKAAPHKIKSFLEEKESEGIKELSCFFDFYENSKNILLITDKREYAPSKNHGKMELNYDSYKKGVLFYRANFWLKILESMLKRYEIVIFVSSNKNKIKQFQAKFKSNGYAILCKNKREKLRNLELENVSL